MLEQIKQRIAELTANLHQSIANHNYISGALDELKKIHDLYESVHGALPVIAAVVPEVQKVIQDVEEAVPAVEQAIESVIHPQ